MLVSSRLAGALWDVTPSVMNLDDDRTGPHQVNLRDRGTDA